MEAQISLASILLLAWCLSLNLVAGQGAPAPAPLNETCEGVVLQYQVDTVTKIYPFLAAKDPDQPYKFESTLTLTNQGFKEVKAWQVFVGFQHREILVTAVGVVLGDGQQLPAVVGNGTTLAGFPQTDLKNSIETAGDATQITATISLTGTEFGVAPPSNPLPNNISLLNEGWKCGLPISSQKRAKREHLCFICMGKGHNKSQCPKVQHKGNTDEALVTISNDNPLGRLDNWNLTWEWSQGEFINSMQGAATADEQDQSDCLKGVAGTYYKDLDFSQVMNCQQRFIPFCCRNGTLLPPIMDPSKSKSAFKLQVFKIPPHTPRGQLVPPINWNIGAGYHCGQPRLVAPLEFPDPSGNFHHLSATCACGCTTMQLPTCDTKSEALLVPYNVLLLPSENRTSKAVAWASLNHFAVPKQLPYYTRGWSARLTVLNWDTQPVKAMPGYQNVFSFNGTQFSRNYSTLFLQGKPGLNYFDTTPGINIAAGDGFPSRVVFNGEVCALPNIIPSGAEGRYARYWASFLLAFVFQLRFVMKPLN
ncbi:hypothetical protein O6H91_Y539200 [Diphasiastrum complanatum]|nr:hypothetical protein O6H91_Y539200 [Diphasiastrum complanatum]